MNQPLKDKIKCAGVSKAVCTSHHQHFNRTICTSYCIPPPPPNHLGFTQHRSQRQLKKHKHPYKRTSPQDSAAVVLVTAIVTFSYVCGVYGPETIIIKIKSYLLNSHNSWLFPLHKLSKSGWSGNSAGSCFAIVLSRNVSPWPLNFWAVLIYDDLPEEVTYSLPNWVSALESGEKPGKDKLVLQPVELRSAPKLQLAAYATMLIMVVLGQGTAQAPSHLLSTGFISHVCSLDN